MLNVLNTSRRLVDGQAKYAEYTKGYNVTQIRKIYRENERVNAEKKVRPAGGGTRVGRETQPS